MTPTSTKVLMPTGAANIPQRRSEGHKVIIDGKKRIVNSTNGEKILYDIYPIKMVEGAGTSAATTTTNNVAQPPPKVNKNSDRFSERTDDSVSNRNLLANAFEGLSRNSIEYGMIQEHKQAM